MNINTWGNAWKVPEQTENKPISKPQGVGFKVAEYRDVCPSCESPTRVQGGRVEGCVPLLREPHKCSYGGQPDGALEPTKKVPHTQRQRRSRSKEGRRVRAR